MDFTGPEVYEKLNISKDEKKEYDIVTLPSGSTIYRADREGKKSPSIGVPNFFSDKTSIKPYTGNNPDTISSYTTKRDLKLFVLSFDNIETLADTDQTIADFVDDLYVSQAMYDPSKAPVSFLIPVSVEHNRYLNREFAMIVCSKGYDGWVAFPGALFQRNLDRKAYENNKAKLEDDKRAGEVKYNINPYSPEIVVCNWKDTMVYKGGKRRKMTRKYCKKTPCRKMGFTQKASCRPYKNCFTARAKPRSSR